VLKPWRVGRTPTYAWGAQLLHCHVRRTFVPSLQEALQEQGANDPIRSRLGEGLGSQCRIPKSACPFLQWVIPKGWLITYQSELISSSL
jgi:hypothetical protein